MKHVRILKQGGESKKETKSGGGQKDVHLISFSEREDLKVRVCREIFVDLLMQIVVLQLSIENKRLVK